MFIKNQLQKNVLGAIIVSAVKVINVVGIKSTLNVIKRLWFGRV